ncbi:hypothetical protein [Ferrovibrio terrae]|uniref:hypothetical protein n=1 Tax=Ferrovibrio terrae TaxID=2594003 RepID=UPI0031381D7C
MWSVRLPALGAALLAVGLLAGCFEAKETAPDKRHTSLSNFVQFIQKTGGLKSLNTFYKRRPEINSEESLGVLYDGARTQGEVMRFKDKQLAKEMLPALKAARSRLGESENCTLRGFFIACGEEKFVDVFKKWE